MDSGQQSPEARRAAERFVTRVPGRETWHSFSFGEHYDPRHVGAGPLVALNDDRLAPGAGYPDHPHRDTEIVSWVVRGALTHRDDSGHQHVVRAGEAQVLSAGAGVVHAETVPDDGETTRFVQAWLRPRQEGGAPAYAASAAPSLVEDGPWTGWGLVASGLEPAAPLSIDAAASLYVGRVAPGESLPLEAASDGGGSAYLLVVAGTVSVGGLTLEDGDALRCPALQGLGPVGGHGEVLAWVWEDFSGDR